MKLVNLYLETGALPFKWLDEEAYRNYTNDGRDPVAVKTINNLEIEMLLTIIPFGVVGRAGKGLVGMFGKNKDAVAVARKLGNAMASKQGVAKLDPKQINTISQAVKKHRLNLANTKWRNLIDVERGLIYNEKNGKYIQLTVEEFKDPKLVRAIVAEIKSKPNQSGMIDRIAKAIGKPVKYMANKATGPGAGTASAAASTQSSRISSNDPDIPMAP